MTHQVDESAGSHPDGETLEKERPAAAPDPNLGPDPVIGAGLALFGIFLMGTSGASAAHYVFDVGVGIAVIGAVIFVLFVALSALKQRRLSQAPSEAAPPANAS